MKSSTIRTLMLAAATGCVDALRLHGDLCNGVESDEHDRPATMAERIRRLEKRANGYEGEGKPLPRVHALEEQVLGQVNDQDNLFSRLANMEEVLFGKVTPHNHAAYEEHPRFDEITGPFAKARIPFDRKGNRGSTVFTGNNSLLFQHDNPLAKGEMGKLINLCLLPALKSWIEVFRAEKNNRCWEKLRAAYHLTLAARSQSEYDPNNNDLNAVLAEAEWLIDEPLMEDFAQFALDYQVPEDQDILTFSEDGTVKLNCELLNKRDARYNTKIYTKGHVIIEEALDSLCDLLPEGAEQVPEGKDAEVRRLYRLASANDQLNPPYCPPGMAQGGMAKLLAEFKTFV